MAISGKRIILQNNQALRAKDQNGDVQELVKIDATGELAGLIPSAISAVESAVLVKADQSQVDALDLTVSGKLDSSLKGAANGVAELDANGKIPSAQIPDVALTQYSEVADEAAMLALTAQQGDFAKRADNSKTYMLSGSDPSVLADWKEIGSTFDASGLQDQIDDLDVYAQDIRSDHDALEIRVGSAETDIDALELSVAGKAAQADLDLVEGRVDTLETDIAAKASQLDLDAVESRVDALEAIPAVMAVKELPKTLSAQDITNGYIDLNFAAMSGSIMVFCERVAILEGLDYGVTEVGGVSRLTWQGPSAAGAEEEFAEGDVVYVQYLKN